MKKLINLWRGHGTKILGISQGTIAAVAGVSDLIPPHHLKYYLGASAVLTVWRGYVNSNAKPNP